MAEGSQSVGGGQIATQPFADIGEIPFPYDPTPTRDIYREFLPTDARTVMIVCHPQHYNFIINPALRTNTNGWELTATDYVLNQAVWAINAGRVRADGLALDDLSESGSGDAVFGAGVAAPRVLAHTGEDYIYIPGSAGGSQSLLHSSGVLPLSVICVFDVDTSPGIVGTYLTYDPSPMALNFMILGSDIRGWWKSDEQVIWTGAHAGGRHVYQFVCTSTTIELLVDGVSQGVKTPATARTTQSTGSVRLISADDTSGKSVKLYGADLGGLLIMNPANHNGYLTVTNTGEAGGNWVITRDATGFKTVVVDMPLLLFGGAQKLDAPLSSTMTEATIMVVTRQFGTPGNWTWYSSPTAGTGRTLGYHITGWSGTWISHWNGKDAGVPTGVKTGMTALGSRYTGTSIQAFADGVFSAPTTGAAAPWGRDGAIRIGLDNANANGLEAAFMSAAVFDRALTDAEMNQVAAEMRAGAIPKHGITLDPQSWVGQSILLDGDGTIRIRDDDINSDPSYVYVGPSKDINLLDWYEPGRASAEWTFSAYFLGGKAKVPLIGTDIKPARARLVMHAYYPTKQGVFKSPPEYVGITVVDDPSTLGYPGDAAVADNNGQVWRMKEGPYYHYFATPPVSAVDPLTIMSTGPMPPTGKMPYLMYGTTLYGLKDPYPESAGVTLYQSLGTPQVVVEPKTAVPTAISSTYLIVSGSGDANYDGQVWMENALPFYEATGQQAWFETVDGPWIDLRDDGEWQRLHVQTDAFSREEDGRVSFLNAYWIDCIVEYENCDGVRLSAMMLDPCESPIASYFDGAMTPEPNTDDFLWSKVDNDQVPMENQCISYYYYDQRGRMKWLWDNLRFLVPIGRPYQIFFGAYDRPYIPKSGYSGASPEVKELSL
jgi:hypothetical protein